MPLRFEFHAGRLWLGKARAANPAERWAAQTGLRAASGARRSCRHQPEISGAAVQQVARRSVNAHRYNRYAGGPRRYNWTYYPYWRPYQYRYWQFMYPYGGPMF